jgi:hypothetical protein
MQKDSSIKTVVLFLLLVVIIFIFLFLSPLPIWSAEKNHASSNNKSGKPLLIEATMCEEIKDGVPVNRAILFSIEKGKVICFNAFDKIPERTTIFHKWYFRDKLIYRNRLSLKPPRWSTYSSIKLRDTDRGPWRVDIVNQESHVYQTLRFSIAD